MIAVAGSRRSTRGISTRPAPRPPRVDRAVREERVRLLVRRLPPAEVPVKVPEYELPVDLPVVGAAIGVDTGARPQIAQYPSSTVPVHPGWPHRAAGSGASPQIPQ